MEHRFSGSHNHGNVASTSDDGNALCCEAAVANEGRKRFFDVWLVNTGATFHMTARREWFHQYKPISEGRSVYSCNDHELKIIGIGSIMVKIHDGRSVYSCNDHELKIIGIGSIMVKIHDEASVASHSPSHKVTISWHQKLGHMSKQGMKILVDRKLLPGLTKVSLPFCEYCVISKQHRLKFKASNSRSFFVLELVHSDVWQAPVQSLRGAEYFVSFINDYSRRCWVYPIKKKSDVFEVFKVYKMRVELDSGTKIKCLRTDNGGEYTGDEFELFCRQEGIKRQFTTTYTPQHNGVVKRMNRTLLERARAMLATASLGKLFWAKAVNTACYVINRSPSTAVELKTPMELWTGKPVKYSDLHIFGIPIVKGYRLWDPTAHKVVVSRDMEKEFQSNDSSEAVPQHEVNEMTEYQASTTRSIDRERRRPGWQAYYVMESNVAYCILTEDGEPLTLQEALNNPDAKKGLTQRNISPVVRMISIQVVLAMCDTYDLHLEQLDVKTTFLHGNLEDQIYMLQPEGFKQKRKRELGLQVKQISVRFKQRFGNNDFIILLLYVNDMLVSCPNKDRINKLKAQLAREFEMKDLGPANKILGMQIHRDRVSRKIWLSQKSYVKKILQRFNMQDCKPISTPFPIDVKLYSKMSPSSEKERMKMSQVPYALVVGSLMFTMICTRPVIAHAVGVVSRYMTELGRGHWEAVKRIFRYVKGTSDVALCFGDSDLIVTGYVDSDYAGDLDGSKSTTGYVFILSGRTVSWVSKLQSVVAMSTTEVEYVTAAQASKEAAWLKMLLEELGYKQEKITLFCENQSALYLARNLAFHSKTKHIRVEYHFIREKVEEGIVDMQKIHIDDNVADCLTKAINGDKFKWKFLDQLVHPIPKQVYNKESSSIAIFDELYKMLYHPGNLTKASQVLSCLSAHKLYGVRLVKIPVESVETFKKDKCDLIVVDTSAYHIIDDIHQVYEATVCSCCLFHYIAFVLLSVLLRNYVAHAALDQDQAFRQSATHEIVILTKMDCHAKGCGALSAVAATNSLVIFLDTGEIMDEFESFDVRKIFKHLKQSFMPRKDFKAIIEGVHATLKKVVPKMVDHITNDFRKNNIPRTVAAAIKHELQNVKKDIATMVDSFLRNHMSNHILHVHPTASVSSSIPDLQHQLYLKMKDDEQALQADISIWLSLKIKFERTSPLVEPCRIADVRTHDHEDHHDDDAREEHQYHLDQMLSYMKSQIVWESKEEDLTLQIPKKPALVFQTCTRNPKISLISLVNHDLFYLKYGNIKAKRYVPSLDKIHAFSFLKDDLEELNTRWIVVKRADGEYSEFLGLDYKYLHKNDIEDMYLMCINGTIKDYRQTGLLRVLEKVKKFNLDVKHGYANLDLSNEDAECIEFYEEYIQERLRHRDQMRCWESYVNGRPLQVLRERPE
nr:retrovirus-related Pol polyprotein from transposon TNT 1-94 [Tanacetum cinerariifolium]